MTENQAINYRQLLQTAKTILLIDWPNPEVPLNLLKAGFDIYGYSPKGYGKMEPGIDENEKLIFLPTSQPPTIDVVNIYRPEEEHAGIINKHILPLKARVLWLHPPLTSAKTAELARQLQLVFIEGVDIAAVARSIVWQ